MLFKNSNPSSCPFSGCSLASQPSCTGYYLTVLQSCSVIGLSVTSAGVLSVPNIDDPFNCCQYVMTCQANGQTQTSNPFQIYTNWVGSCNNDDSGGPQMDISASSSPPNKIYAMGQGISNIFQEEVLISDYFYFPNQYDQWPGSSCTCSTCTYIPGCVINECYLVDNSTLNVISLFQIFPYPNQTFVFQVQTSSLYSQLSVQLKCTAAFYDYENVHPSTYFYSDSFEFSIQTKAQTVITLTGSQQLTFNLANYISSSTGYCNSFSNSLTSCQILQYGSTLPYVLSSSLSETSFSVVFDSVKFTQTDNFQLFCTLSNGLTFSNVFNIQVTQCSPSITISTSYIQTVTSAIAPFSVFTPKSSDAYPSFCSRQSYRLYDSTGLFDVSLTATPYSFSTVTGEFKIKSFKGYFSQIFFVQVTNKINSTPQNTTSIKSGAINVTYYVVCTPSINGLRNAFSYSINFIKFPYSIFKASDFASTTNPNYCALSYQILNQDGSTVLNSQNMTLNHLTGEFQIHGYSNYPDLYFKSNIKLLVTSKYSQSNSAGQTTNQSISVYIYTCYPLIFNFLIQTQNLSYIVDPYASVYNPQLILAFYPDNFTTTASKDNMCKLTYKLYFKNGIEATTINSQFSYNQEQLGLYLTSNKGFTETYYYQATATSLNPAYSNSVNSKPFTINVKSDPMGTSIKISRLKTLPTQFHFSNFSSNANVTYTWFPECYCNIQNTNILMNGFNPNFFISYESSSQIQVNFTSLNSNNNKCLIKSYLILLPLPKYLDQIFSSASDQIQSFTFKQENIIFGKIYKFKIMIIASTGQGSTCGLNGKYIGQDKQNIILDAQIIVKRNCSNDKVYQIQAIPLKDESYFNSYKFINGYPVLFLNISQQQNINVDFSLRFNNDYPECLLSYKIFEIQANGSVVNMNIASSFISLSKNGIFSVKKQLIFEFVHYQVFILAQNEANVKSIINGYLIDLSVHPLKIRSKTKSNQNSFSNNNNYLQSQSQVCSGQISSVSKNGLVKIKFNDIIGTHFNISWINETNTQMYVKPGNNRQEDEDYDVLSVNFTWYVQSFINKTMFLQLNFDNPLEISPLIQQDKLIINFNSSQNLINCANKKTSLDSDYSVMIHNIPPQMASQQDVQQIGQVAQLFSSTPVWLLAVGSIVLVVGFGNMKYMVIYIRTLQLIMLLTSIEIVFPANVVNYLTQIHKVVSYDILSFFNLYALPILNRIQFDSNPTIYLIDQMQDVGYDNRNAMLGLATFTFLIIIYFFRLILVLLMKLICKILGGKYYSQQIYDYVSQNMSFNPILQMSIEGFFDFMIFGYLNMKTAQFTSNGEILGFSFGIFSLLASGLILPIITIVALTITNKNKLEEKGFEHNWRAVFEMVKTQNMSTRIYMIVFYIRRMIILASCFFSQSQYSSLILFFNCLANYIYSLYIGSTKPLESRQINNLEIFNEFFVASSTFSVMILSDWVGSQQKIYFHGFFFVILIIFHSSSNMIIILMKAFNNVILILTKAYNLFQSYSNKYQKTKGSFNNNIIELKQINQNKNMEGNQQILINEQEKKQRQSGIFYKILDKQNEMLSNIDLSQQAKINKAQSNNSSIKPIHPIIKIIQQNKNNQDEYILSFDKAPVITSFQKKQIHSSINKNQDKTLIKNQSKYLSQNNKEKTMQQNLKLDAIQQKFMVLFNKYEFLYITNDDLLTENRNQKNYIFEILDPYVFNHQDQKSSLLRKSKLLINYAKMNVKSMKIKMKKQEIKNPDEQIIKFQDELFDFINANYILKQRFEKKEFLQYIK